METYGRHQAVDVCPDLGVHRVVGDLGVLHLGRDHKGGRKQGNSDMGSRVSGSSIEGIELWC